MLKVETAENIPLPFKKREALPLTDNMAFPPSSQLTLYLLWSCSITHTDVGYVALKPNSVPKKILFKGRTLWR